MKLELTLGGQEFLSDLEKTVMRLLEEAAAKLGGETPPKKDPEPVEEVEEIDEPIVDEDESDEEDEAPVKKKATAKPKKLTVNDVIDACKAYTNAGIENGKPGPVARKATVAILEKKFKVKSVSDLEPEQYADAIKALKVK